MLGLTSEHRELSSSLAQWADSLGAVAAVRDSEESTEESFAAQWRALTEMAVPTIGLPESAGGGGGSVVDVAVALEACARSLVPGGLLSAAVAASLLGESSIAGAIGEGARVSLVLDDLALDPFGADYFLVCEPSAVSAYDASDVTVTAGESPLDLTRRAGTAVVAPEAAPVAVVEADADVARRAFVTLAAAEAAGVARWCLDTAVEYAGVREQFGAKIGSFQAIKHLCAQMLETVESIEAAAWDAASVAFGDDEQWEFAADVASAVCFGGAVRVAQDCIQVLGGIGFTFEHDAHLYLRRALGLRLLTGSADAAAARLASRASDGVRRVLALDLEGRDEVVREEIRAKVAGIDAADPRPGLVETGLLMPHWPTPYGLGADAVTQLVVDEELSAAGLTRPDLKIAGWAVATILEHGTDEQRERFVTASLLGDISWCQLFSEPGAGSDLASLRTRAIRDGDGWRLTGQKVWTSLAHDAEWAICLARTDPEAPQHKGITYFLLDMASDGIDIRPLRELTGDAMFNEVFLENVFVPDDCVVGEVNAGWKLARTTLANERVAMAGTKLGRSTEACVAALSTSSTLADLTQVGHQVALATVCSLLGARTTLKALAGQGPGAESSVAKLLGVRNRQDASELLVSLLGPAALLGSTPEHREAVHEMLLTRCLSIAGGTTQILRTLAAERILGLPR